MNALLLVLLLAQTRLASDFEIAQMEKQLAASRDFEAQLAGRLNLGDLRAARNEPTLARAEYERAYALAEKERLDARRESRLTRYANATSYAALARAKLRDEARAFSLLEEAARYASDDAEAWNLYASAMRVLGHPRKAINAARNAVLVATKPLDVALYRHVLAGALIEAGEPAEAEQLLVTVTTTLRSEGFATLRRQAAREEAFEVYSSARGDVAAYVSLLNRAQLGLAALYEKRGATESARAEYRRVLEHRSDDPTALTALARLAGSEAERERLYAEAFAANPFSSTLIREYRRSPTAPATDMQRALIALDRGDRRAARELLDAMLVKFPANETLLRLRREAEPGTFTMPSPSPSAAELRALIDVFERLTAEQRAALDAVTFTSDVVNGAIAGVPVRLTAPVTTSPVRYRILGVGENGVLLLEPVS
jgi:tetratricopeptide (TPR) repeat protein